ncbi:hypothetical protein RRX38_04765 [Pseudomonas sp. DTU_2021_1001937_2_SI_NGA_ILE_001]|uniref:hypothetical protein n=1 Tax=Pseudomonas sp. DTU_2021_1001937_2_SI_NGA_ILE_001 TaxID=3077589 RepID=UPI0025E00ED8|nr:hypothetical protein [Pseudomonas sp. DTU_2021_1001937_2_SI_NGA_ILE_001]WNW10490.1 hypothetical protein RRX38_04765 [Pseudomonas sp. DTU_2021_1001937_2_SI_NGA_ILE_001]
MKVASRLKISAVLLTSLLLAACGKSVEGTYTVASGPVKGVKLTLGKEKFSFETGASGTYEVSGDNVIFTGMTFNGTMHIEGKNLVNDKWRFERD